jgi:hypothetical protein
VLQKAGLIPTIVTLLFLCYFSMFSSISLIETGRLLQCIKNNTYRNFNYIYLIDSLISDCLFAFASKALVVINHLVYAILCIITFSRITMTFFIERYDVFKPILEYMNNSDQNSHIPIILSNSHMIVLMIGFCIFLVIFALVKATDPFNKIFNYLIIMLSIALSCLILFRISIIFTYEKPKQSFLEKVPLFGADYTYVKIS